MLTVACKLPVEASFSPANLFSVVVQNFQTRVHQLFQCFQHDGLNRNNDLRTLQQKVRTTGLKIFFFGILLLVVLFGFWNFQPIKGKFKVSTKGRRRVQNRRIPQSSTFSNRNSPTSPKNFRFFPSYGNITLTSPLSQACFLFTGFSHHQHEQKQEAPPQPATTAAWRPRPRTRTREQHQTQHQTQHQQRPGGVEPRISWLCSCWGAVFSGHIGYFRKKHTTFKQPTKHHCN